MDSVFGSDSAWILSEEERAGPSDCEMLVSLLEELVGDPAEADRRCGLARTRADVAWSFRIPAFQGEDEGE